LFSIFYTTTNYKLYYRVEHFLPCYWSFLSTAWPTCNDPDRMI